MSRLNKKKAVIGIGSVLRKDDGIGISVFESLKERGMKEGIDYFNFGIASFDILLRIKEYRQVLIIDGINASLPAGELRIFKLDDIDLPLDVSYVSSHELKLPDLSLMLKKLGVKTKVFVAGIQVDDVSFGEGLSEGLVKKQEQIVERIQEFINKEFSGKA